MSYALREALAAFRRAPVLTGLASAMVGMALYVVGLFGLVAYNLQTSLALLEERVEVVAYLRDDVRTEEIELAVAELREIPEVRGVEYVSKDRALEDARAEFPDFQQVFADLEVNPLPASLEVELQAGSRTEENVDRIAQVASAFPFVEEVTYGEEWVDRLFTLRRIGALTALIVGTAFAVVAALIIGTALRIAIFARRDEIYIMRLVGAKDAFVRRPFLLEGALAGLLGGALALALTWLTFRGVDSFLFTIAWIPAAWAGAGVAVAVVFGVAASSLAVRRHLREVT
ncbi:MAG: ABC transporter permease [Gemmatimonadales bacterium]|jgi:cell division transport system permease protein|nr:MAG: ABC transporter permease [Gemmatimonadales bacterium]